MDTKNSFSVRCGEGLTVKQPANTPVSFNLKQFGRVSSQIS